MWKALMRFLKWIKLAESSGSVDQNSIFPLENKNEVQLKKPQVVDIDFDKNFMQLVLSVNVFTDVAPSRFEQAVLAQLDELLLSSSLDKNILPRLPAVVPQLLSSLKNDDVFTTRTIRK
jgi:hypothetical protein